MVSAINWLAHRIAVHLPLTLILLQGLALPVTAFGSAEQCQAIFADDESYVSNIRRAMGLHTAITRALTSSRDFSIEFIQSLKTLSVANGRLDGDRYTQLENTGELNHGVLRVERSPTPTILKIIMSHPENGYAEQVRGAYIGSALGGPAVHAVGLVPDLVDRSPRVYLEMEELFPGQTRFTMKDNFRTDKLLTLNEKSMTVAAMLVEMMFDAASKKVFVRDPDVMLTNAGAVRWIDTNGFSFSETVFEAHERVIFEVTSLLFQSRSRPSLNQEIVSAFLNSLENTQSLAEIEKVDLLKKLLKQTSRLSLKLPPSVKELLQDFETRAIEALSNNSDRDQKTPQDATHLEPKDCGRFSLSKICRSFIPKKFRRQSKLTP